MVTVGDKIVVVFGREQVLQSSHTQILLWRWVDFLFFLLETSQSASLNYSLLTVPTNVIMTGTGIVIQASFGFSFVTDPEGKNIQKRSLHRRFKWSLYIFLAQFLVKKNFFWRALGFYFFPAKTAYRDELKFQWSPKILSPPQQAISNDRSLMSNTTEVIISSELQWPSKVLRHLAVKFDFRANPLLRR